MCLDRCVEPAGFGEACSSDPCDPSAPVCGPGLGCLDLGEQATCAVRPGLSVAFCRTNLQPSFGCGAGTYCRGLSDAVDAAYACDVERPGFVPEAYDGQCVPPAREGSRCDASWGEPGCAVCEAGTECLTDPRDERARVCLRPCQDASECVCPSDDLSALDTCQVTLPEPSGEQGACTGCAASGQECSAGGWGCCDPMDACEGGACCRAVGSTCGGGGGRCCGEAQCVDGTCRTCGVAGSAPDAVLGCCEGLEEQGGVCVVPCTDGEACSPPGCPERMGMTQCSPSGGECVVEVSAEACDGVDNDCDGGTDEGIAPRACSADPGGCGRTFPGTQTCRGRVGGVPDRGLLPLPVRRRAAGGGRPAGVQLGQRRHGRRLSLGPAAVRLEHARWRGERLVPAGEGVCRRL